MLGLGQQWPGQLSGRLLGHGDCSADGVLGRRGTGVAELRGNAAPGPAATLDSQAPACLAIGEGEVRTSEQVPSSSAGEVVVYVADDGAAQVDVRLDGDAV